MMSTSAILKVLETQKILPLFYHGDASVCVGVIGALYNSGVRMVEFTNRGTDALARFTELVALSKDSFPEMKLALGTICSGADAQAFIAAGADVLISPFWDEEVSAVAQEAGVTWIPGCMTPSDVHRAVKNGHTIVKLFPGNVLGTGFVEAIRPVFPSAKFIVTGGVEASAEGVEKWLKAGVVAAGLGSKLINDEVLVHNNYTLLQEKVSALLKEIQS